MSGAETDDLQEISMPTWTFFGRVLPERVPLTWDRPLSGQLFQQALNTRFDFRVVVHASQVIVDLTTDQATPNLYSLRNAASDCIRMITDLVGYRQGYYFDVEILSAIRKDTDDWMVFGIEIPVLAEQRKQQSAALDGRLVDAVGRNVAAQIALSDFREAMRIPVGTGFFCYRAIEAMMQSMKGPNDSDGPAWQQLRESLRVDRSAIDAVKQHADFPRHGKPSDISDAERATVFKLTDEIIRRYFEYLVRGNVHLTENEFAVLTA